MDAHFAFWFPSIWTLVGAVFFLFSFALALYVTFVRGHALYPSLMTIKSLYESGYWELASLREVLTNDPTSRTVLIPLGESIAQTSCALRELTIDLQALANAIRETRERAEASMTDSQEPALPVLLEILAEVRKMSGGPKIQRGRLPPFSLHLMKAQAEALARERMQANPKPFPELD